MRLLEPNASSEFLLQYARTRHRQLLQEAERERLLREAAVRRPRPAGALRRRLVQMLLRLAHRPAGA